MINPEKSSNPAKGIFLVLIAFLGFSVMSAFVKVCSEANLSTQEIVFFQNFTALIVVLPWVFRGKKQSLKPKNTALVFGRAIIGFLSMYFFFLAIKLTPLVNATLLQNTTPIFIPLIAFFVFHKKITLKILLVMIAGFIGVTMVLNPGKGSLNPGDFIALFSGLLSAGSTVIIKILNDKDEHIKVVILYYLAITTAVMGVWAIPTWSMPHGMLWMYLILSGVLYAAFQLLLIISMKYATTTIIAPFIYFAVVFSGIIDWLVWKEVPHLITVFGVLIVIASAIFSTLHHKKFRIPMQHR